MPQSSPPSTPPQRVQVLERWNHWVRVRFEQSGNETWIDLAETPFAPLSPATCGGGGPEQSPHADGPPPLPSHTDPVTPGPVRT